MGLLDWLLGSLGSEGADDATASEPVEPGRLERSVGIEVKGGLFERVLERRRGLPAEETEVFTPVGEDQTTVEVRVFQGDSEIAAENDFLGELVVSELPDVTAGDRRIPVTFAVDESEALTVTTDGSGGELSVGSNPREWRRVETNAVRTQLTRR